MAEMLRREIALACSPERAFRAFTEHVDLWWPRTHRKSRDHAMRFTPEALIQIAVDGTEWTMGRVLAFEPPGRLALDWFAGAATDPTHVEITFAAEAAGTRVTIIHRPLTAETIELWPKRVAIFVNGWEAVLGGLKQHVEGGQDG
jgi:uncharacterized protein YndB with AHSA1/START domain